MPKREWRLFAKDIKEECELIKQFTAGMSFEEFDIDTKTVYAVIKSLENIGEAAKFIPTEIKNKYPEIEWQKITDMRNLLTHHYFGVDERVLWNTLNQRIPLLRNTIEQILKN